MTRSRDNLEKIGDGRLVTRLEELLAAKRGGRASAHFRRMSREKADRPKRAETAFANS
jgi:hypothetical protein